MAEQVQPGQYIFKDGRFDNTYKSFSLVISVNDSPVDLTDYTIIAEFRINGKTGKLSKTISTGSGITITDAPNGVIQIDSFFNDLEPSVYYHDFKFIKPSGETNTYIQGTFTSLQNVTQQDG